MATVDLSEANLVLDVLRRFHEELEAISDAGERLKQSRSPEVDEYRRLVHVTSEIKNAAKRGTLDGVKRSQTELERCFYGPAVQQASANFTLRTDAPPSKWLSGLYDPADDISYYMHALQKLIHEASPSAR